MEMSLVCSYSFVPAIKPGVTDTGLSDRCIYTNMVPHLVNELPEDLLLTYFISVGQLMTMVALVV